MHIKTFVLAAGLAVFSPNAFPLSIDEAAAGRALAARYSPAVVSIELTISIKTPTSGNSASFRENTLEINGTIISPSGLVITTLSPIDPRSTVEASRSDQKNQEAIGLNEMELKGAKMYLPDGSTVQLAIVSKRPDLDIVLLKPILSEKESTPQFPFVDLRKEAKGEVLETYLFVSHAAKNLQRACIVRPTILVSVLMMPRHVFLLTDQAIGAPVFDLSGHVLGITTQYFSNGKLAGLVVCPASEIAEFTEKTYSEKE